VATSPDISHQLTLAGLTDGQGLELLSIEQDRAANRCTASSLDGREVLRSAILHCIAEGRLGTRRIADVFGVSREVVRALWKKASETNELDHYKKEVAHGYAHLARLAVERMTEEIDDMPRASLPVLAAIATDKHALLSGGVTARVERVGGPSVASVKDFIDSLPVVSGSVVTGAGGEQKGAAGGGLGMIEAGGLVVDLGGKSGGGDSISPVNAGSSEGGGA
jgi:predicted XRE-type DNA-binding protein